VEQKKTGLAPFLYNRSTTLNAFFFTFAICLLPFFFCLSSSSCRLVLAVSDFERYHKGQW